MAALAKLAVAKKDEIVSEDSMEEGEASSEDSEEEGDA